MNPEPHTVLTEPRSTAWKPRRFLGGAFLSAALVLVAGCAGDDSSDEQDGAAGTSDAETAEDSSAEDSSAEESPEDEDSSAEGSADESSGDSESQEGGDAASEGPASNVGGMAMVDTITTPTISPKSVVASGDGLVIANNMMYQHTATIYDAESREMLHNLSDTLSFEDFGLEGYPDEVQGSPVEAVWSEDGQYAYVSQYMLYGVGATADDECSNGEDIAPSVIYRYNAEEEDWDDVIEVGRVPKFVEITPDGETLLVSNWCDSSLSVVDLDSGEETETVPLNTAPRGIAVLPDNSTAYVTAMHANELYKVDLDSGESELIYDEALMPRHLVLSLDGEELYVTFANSNKLMAFDTSTDEVIRETDTGEDPRSMEISPDGTALYVVNYGEATASKFDAETFEELDRQSTGELPIGVTYESVTDTVWVANYSGTINIFEDTDEGEGEDDAAGTGDDGSSGDGSSSDGDSSNS